MRQLRPGQSPDTRVEQGETKGISWFLEVSLSIQLWESQFLNLEVRFSTTTYVVIAVTIHRTMVTSDLRRFSQPFIAGVSRFRPPEASMEREVRCLYDDFKNFRSVSFLHCERRSPRT